MTELLFGLVLLACPVGMALMMLMMGKGMMGGRKEARRPEDAQHEGDEDLAALKAEQARVAERVERLERERAGRRRSTR